MPNDNCYIDARENVEKHLQELHDALSGEEYELDILPKKKNQSESNPHSTAYTMQTLEFDSEDVRRVLLSLRLQDYIENMIDNKKIGTADFRVFGVIIDGKEIYIKEKLRAEDKVFCVSFHFAEFRLKDRPYK